MTRTLVGPKGWNARAYTGRLSHSAMRVDNAGAASRRREWCKHSPILFALFYLLHHVLLPGSGGVALSLFHVELAEAAKRWVRSDLEPKEVRDAWVAPRFSGKSTWLFCILVIWALAYEHRKFIAVYADTLKQAKIHLATVRLELSTNDRLRRDFPELCSPMLLNGRPIMNHSEGYAAANGTVIMVMGMDSATLGVKFREQRPDTLIFDDMEPKEGRYPLDLKEKRLAGLLQTVLPIDPRAVVQFAGTTVMKGSMIDDMIEGKDWVTAQRIRVRHYLPILIDPVTGEQSSFWPGMWPLDFLHAEREADPEGFAKNYENRPRSPKGSYWTGREITYRDLTQHVSERILVIDPAAKSKKQNDETAIGLLAHVGNLRKVVVERVEGYRLDPAALHDLVVKIIEMHDIRLVLVDTTNGGDHVLNTLRPLPKGVAVKEVPAKKMYRGKTDRFGDLHRLYQRGRIVHRMPLTTLEDQMCAYPKHTLHDDQIDVVAMGVEELLWDDPEFAAIRKRVVGS